MFDLIGGKAADARCDVTLFGAGPQSGQDAPGRDEHNAELVFWESLGYALGSAEAFLQNGDIVGGRPHEGLVPQ
ncbi:hypothetical protein [Streptomyces pseudogriseolus]|uniref:hypothetical protein n=1 Tax=Streptomyces pseudogriseolus TaxID=36817 RepID=UPI003FA24C80